MVNLLEKIENNRAKNGSVLIFAILLLATMLLLSSYFISFSLTGSRMSESQIYAAKSYYLAETGIQEAIFKLKNDDDWRNAFETMPKKWQTKVKNQLTEITEKKILDILSS